MADQALIPAPDSYTRLYDLTRQQLTNAELNDSLGWATGRYAPLESSMQQSAALAASGDVKGAIVILASVHSSISDVANMPSLADEAKTVIKEDAAAVEKTVADAYHAATDTGKMIAYIGIGAVVVVGGIYLLTR